MIQSYFLSDLHLGSSKDPKFFLLISWLKNLKSRDDITHLFLLGDIFDLWVGDYSYFVEEYKEFISEIKRLQCFGVEIHYFEGNHDLYLHSFWGQKLGVHVHPEDFYIPLGEKVFCLEHGDLMDKEDRGYLFLRWFLRCSPIRWILNHLPEFLILKIGIYFSKKSRSYTSQIKTIDSSQSIKVIRSHAKNKYQEKQFDYIITGHMHCRDEYKFHVEDRAVSSINLGTWLKDSSVLYYAQQGEKEVLQFRSLPFDLNKNQ